MLRRPCLQMHPGSIIYKKRDLCAMPKRHQKYNEKGYTRSCGHASSANNDLLAVGKDEVSACGSLPVELSLLERADDL